MAGYAVIQTVALGRWSQPEQFVWGPFSEASAERAKDALRCLASTQDAVVVPLLSSKHLSSELPDWRRTEVTGGQFMSGDSR